MLAPKIERFRVKRKVDNSGRIWLPILFTRILNFENEKNLCVTVEEDYVVIEREECYDENKFNNILVKYDGKGKLTIPRIARDYMGIMKNSIIGLSLDVNKIYITKCSNSCVVCGKSDRLLNNESMVMCENCLSEFKDSNVGGQNGQ